MRRRVSFIFLLAFGVILLVFQSQFSIVHQKAYFEKLLVAGNYNFISTDEASSISPLSAFLEDNNQRRTYKLLYLNQTTPERLQRAHREFLSTNPSSTFDILSISSKFNLRLPHTQHETFASHQSVRNFIIATEDDDPDPTCYKTTTMENVEKQSRTCKHYKHWQDLNAFNKLTKYFSNGYARINWLKGKQNPSGWLCAQKRFHYAFVKYIELLEQSQVLIPDYLMIMDEDTFVNVHHLEKYLMQTNSTEKDDGNVPLSSQTPVIYAGCRVRAPASSSIKFTFPFGGWGIYLSQGAMKKWVAPIDCTNQDNTEQVELCHRYSDPTSVSSSAITIGEQKFFQNGMNLNQVFRLYLEKHERYCLHGDWFFGYIANYLNMSRHVIPTAGEFPVVGYGGESAKWFDQNGAGPENRLHTIMGSEQYKFAEGLCLYGNGMYNEDGGNEKIHYKNAHFYIQVNKSVTKGDRKLWRNSQECIYNTTICHYVKDPNDMKRLYTESENHRRNSFHSNLP